MSQANAVDEFGSAKTPYRIVHCFSLSFQSTKPSKSTDHKIIRNEPKNSSVKELNIADGALCAAPTRNIIPTFRQPTAI